MPETTASYPPRSRAWLSAAVIFVLTAIAVADRMAISMLIGPIKRDFGIGDFQASLLVGLAFTLFYVVFLLPIGAMSDRYSRKTVLGVCLVIWSIATIACGFAVGFASLFVLRMLVGAGEAAIGPCSHGIIGDSFPREALAKPLALQGIGFQVGPAIGVAAAGAILTAGATGAFAGWPLLGELAPWRIAFVLIGLPGIFALLLVPFLHAPRRANPAQTKAEPVLPFLKQNRKLMTLVYLSAGVSAMPLGVVTGWVPEYLQRVLHVSPMVAGATMGSTLLAAAVLGQGLYSVLVDWLAARGVRDAPIKVGLLPAVLAVPLTWVAFDAGDAQRFTALLFAFLLCITPFNALNNTVAQQLAPPALRSRIAAQMILSISIIGFALAPALVGWLSEYVFGEVHLATAMRLVVSVSAALNLVLLLMLMKPFIAYVNSRKD
jgi:MFS family permease